MLRGSRSSILLLAPAIPRQVWDPKHYNHKHVDSYAKGIVDRRVWPAKKYIVGTQPVVRDDWNQFSVRNLAYQYNAKLRACTNFPEMIPVYAEMKGRGIKLDSDTMSVMLSRGARFTAITPQDLFLLFEEMLSLGAKPDIAVVEVLHTILDHAPQEVGSVWRESKRLALISHYDALCADEIARLGEQKLGHLLASQVTRYRKNIASLDGRLSTTTWRQYMSLIPTVELLFEELANFLGEYVPKALAEDFPRSEMRFSNVAAIPHLFRHSALSRPTNKPTLSSNTNTNANNSKSADASSSALSIPYAERMAYRSQFADDLAINDVLLSALERFIDVPLETRLPRSDEPALLLILEKFVKTSGVLVTADLAAQMMEVCKFATNFSAESAAVRILQMAYHGSAVPTTPYRNHWRLAEVGVDGRVLGRYLGARNPWGKVRFDISANGRLDNFALAEGGSGSASEGAAVAGEEGKTITSGGEETAAGSDGVADRKTSSKLNSASQHSYTAAAVHERWESVLKAVNESGVLDLEHLLKIGQPIDPTVVMEVYTGQACFLRNMFLEERYPVTEEFLRLSGQLNTDPDAFASRKNKTSVASRYMTVEAAEAIFRSLQSMKKAMDRQIIEAKHMKGVEGGIELTPELECWESMLIVSKHMMDFLLTRRDQGGSSGRQVADDLFKLVAHFRNELLEESKEKYGGRFKILWLQEM